MNNIQAFKNSISKLLIHPLVWRVTGFVSSIVGFTCYALSPSFHNMFGQWGPRKIILYSVVSSLLSVFMIFIKRCSGGVGKSLLLKAHVGFVVLMLTSLWSYLEDRSEQGKVENEFGKMMNLTSTWAFALMAMSISRQVQLGFEVGVTNFLVGCFLVTLMKMSLKLTAVAAFFCYLLLNVRSISDFLLEMRAHVVSQHADNTVEENLQLPTADSDISSDLNAFYINYWNNLKSTIKRDYFSSPWQTVNTIAGVGFFILNLVRHHFSNSWQTFSTIVAIVFVIISSVQLVCSILQFIISLISFLLSCFPKQNQMGQPICNVLQFINSLISFLLSCFPKQNKN